MPDTLFVKCFQTFQQHRRLSEKLNDISGDDADVKEIKDYDVPDENEKKRITDMAHYIYEWLSLKEKYGFIGCLIEEDRHIDNDLKSVAAEFAIGDSNDMIKKDDILETDITVWRDDKPCGKGTITLRDGSELWGTFRKGRRDGRGSIFGGRLKKMGVRNITGFYSAGVLKGQGRVEWIDGRVLDGMFKKGYLEGFCIAKSKIRGQDLYVGEYMRGVAVGPSWKRLEGGGWLHGVVDLEGKFTGEDIMYIYPDMFTCLVGKFRDGIMIEARESRVNKIVKGDILEVKASTPKPVGRVFSFQPSDGQKMAVDYQQQDPYERDRVECRNSQVKNAGEGLFAITNIPQDTVICFYHGIYLKEGQNSPQDNWDYQIFIDWQTAPASPALDILPDAWAYKNYKASLGHKVNHSWQPNCMYAKFNHPVFGHTALGVRTIKSVEKGEELTAHYRYDPQACPDWYYDL